MYPKNMATKNTAPFKILKKVLIFPFRIAGKHLATLSLIALFLIVVAVDIPRVPVKFSAFGRDVNVFVVHPKLNLSKLGIDFQRELEPKLGLDLQGGADITLRLKMDEIPSQDRDAALQSARDIIERRVNGLGVSEPVIQTSVVGNDYRINVQLAGISDVNQALSLIGSTAQLKYKELTDKARDASTSASLTQADEIYKDTELTGKDLKRAIATPASGSSKNIASSAGYVITLEFTSEGAKKFEDITGRNIGKPIAVFLDDELITQPTVQQKISGGTAQISGNFDAQTAKSLSNLLNGGALPAPIEIIKQTNVGPTLGSESLQKSLIATVIGLLSVIIFMIFYYRWLGVVASVALIFYTLLTFAIFKFIPITLTLAGIAGFVLSIGMAVDANILIFERIKEEKNRGRDTKVAINLGFSRAWSSIRDSNVSSLITASILFYFGSSIVKGFALTLAIGVLVSMFSAISFSRKLLKIFYR